MHVVCIRRVRICHRHFWYCKTCSIIFDFDQIDSDRAPLQADSIGKSILWQPQIFFVAASRKANDLGHTAVFLP